MKDSMNYAVVVTVLPVLLVLALVASRDAEAQTSLGAVSMQGSASVGVFPGSGPATNVAKYREYSDLAQQVIAPELHLLLGDKSDDRVFADFHAYNLGQNNQMYNLHAGVYGLLDIQIQYLDMPHYLSDDVGSIAFSQNGGNFTLSSHPAPPTGGEPPGKNIGTWVNAVANPTAMSLLNGVANLNIRYTPDPHWTYTAQLSFQNPGANDYSFGSVFGPSRRAYNISQVTQPVNSEIYNYGAGVDYAAIWWTLGSKYNGSFLENQNWVLTWSNPDVWSELSPN